MRGPGIQALCDCLFQCYLSSDTPLDSFDVFMNRDTGDNMTCCNRTNIAWDSDRSVRFQNPNGASIVSPEDLFNTTMPPNWPRDLANIPGGLENESLIVWFRVSAFPIFRKLYGRLEVDGSTDVDLPAGDYSISLTYSILLLMIMLFSVDTRVWPHLQANKSNKYGCYIQTTCKLYRAAFSSVQKLCECSLRVSSSNFYMYVELHR